MQIFAVAFLRICRAFESRCFMIEYVVPAEIEKKSFEIIEAELKAKNIILPEDEKPWFSYNERCLYRCKLFKL